MAKDDDEEKSFSAGDPKDASSYKRYPVKPSMWDQVKETFEPTANRIMIDQIRKRRQAAQNG